MNNCKIMTKGGHRSRFVHTFEDITSADNLLSAWKEFLNGKRSKPDVQEFSLNLMDNILALHKDLVNRIYQHGLYQGFRINDPKPRQIHKSPVRDRLLHHVVYRLLYPFFDLTFIADSFSCRVDKGTHKALSRFRKLSYVVSRNHTRATWVLKCDIRKFFENINHEILLNILKQYIPDEDIVWLLNEIICSFNPGLPLGNLTSQLFMNIYMNEFDQWLKHRMKARYYIRYADDFVVLSHDKAWLEELLPKVADFLSENLRLSLHPDKVSIQTLASGVDFLGWVHFPDHRVLRTTTKRRMLKKLNKNNLQSYLGLLQHGNTQEIIKRLK